MTVVELRSAVGSDVGPIADLERATFGPDAWSEQAVAEELAAPGRSSVVALHGGDLLGYAVTRTVGDVADLQRVVVAPTARRRGLGTRMVRELLDGAARQGAQRVLLEVSEANAAALGCYRAMGFREIDRRTGYYRDGTDALVLELHITARTEEET